MKKIDQPDAYRQGNVETADVAEKPPVFGHERILVVDDEQEIAAVVQKALERLGYRVTAVYKSLDALSLFTEDPMGFNLIITDQTMSGMTGEQLALKLLALRPDILIILWALYYGLAQK